MLYRSPDRFLAGLNPVAAQEQDGQYPSHWRVNHCVLQQVRQLVAQMEQQEGENDLPSTASRGSYLCNYCSCCVKAVAGESGKQRITSQLQPGRLEEHFADEVNWDAVADQFFFHCVCYIGSKRQTTD